MLWNARKNTAKVRSLATGHTESGPRRRASLELSPRTALMTSPLPPHTGVTWVPLPGPIAGARPFATCSGAWRSMGWVGPLGPAAP